MILNSNSLCKKVFNSEGLLRGPRQCFVCVKVLSVLALILLLGTKVQAQNFYEELSPYKEILRFKDGHSFCERKVGADKFEPNSVRQDELVPLASISKLFTSYWAMSVLGPLYRYETNFYIHLVDSKSIDLHISGSRDPYNTYEKLFFILSELNRLKINKIRHLTFDENFNVYLGHRDPSSANPASLNAWTEDQSLVQGLVRPEKTKFNLELVFNTKQWPQSAKARYNYTYKLAKSLRLNMTLAPQLAVGDVAFLASRDYHPEESAKRLTLKSAPLFRYLKDMNDFSNNYVADQIFLRLGGSSKATQFYANDLKLDSKNLRMFTGSGLPLRNNQRMDNVGSCAAVVKVIGAMSELLRKTKLPPTDSGAAGRDHLDLFDVMIVVGVDEFEQINNLHASTTYQGSDDQEAAAVAKTGLINSALNIAGAAFTNDGIYIFGIFLKTAPNTDSVNPKANGQARDLRRTLISKMMAQHHGAKKLSYKEHPNFFPADEKSYLQALTRADESASLP